MAIVEYFVGTCISGLNLSLICSKIWSILDIYLAQICSEYFTVTGRGAKLRILIALFLSSSQYLSCTRTLSFLLRLSSSSETVWAIERTGRIVLFSCFNLAIALSALAWIHFVPMSLLSELIYPMSLKDAIIERRDSL